MRHIAVVKFFGDLRKCQFIINQQLFSPFNFMGNDEVFNGGTLYLRKKIREVIVVVS